MTRSMEGRNRQDKEVKDELRELLEKNGRGTLELAKRLMLENKERIECTEVRKALTYFADEYWVDLIRPTLMRLTCEAVGGESDKIIPAIVPIILITGGMDIHDDIIDQSTTKDGRATVFGKFGKDIALLTGDALLLKGFIRLHQAFRQQPTGKATRILRIIEEMFFELGDAEALELELKGKFDADPEEYLRIVRKKAADVEAYTYISAILGDGTKKEVEAMREYGRILGMLAIICDDLIDMMDEEELEHRLINETAPLPILYTAHNFDAKDMIYSTLSSRKERRTALNRIIQTAIKNGGIAKTQEKMKELAKESSLRLQTIKHKSKELNMLINMMGVPCETEGKKTIRNS